MRVREVSVRATKIDSHSRTKAVRTEGERTCTVCTTVLSVWNPTDRCWQHRTFHRSRQRGVA